MIDASDGSDDNRHIYRSTCEVVVGVTTGMTSSTAITAVDSLNSDDNFVDPKVGSNNDDNSKDGSDPPSAHNKDSH